MNDELLIKLVKQHPILFDPGHDKYMDSTLKQKIWSKISNQLEGEHNAAFCKARWNNIRDNYRKSWKKSEALGTANARRVKQYKYTSLLQFLNQYFDKRDSRGAAEDQEDTTGDTYEEQGNDDQEMIIIPEGFTLQPIQPICSIMEDAGVGDGCEETEETEGTDEGGCEETVSVQAMPTRPHIRRRIQKRRLQPRESPSATVMKYLIDKNQKAAEGAADPVDAFLAGIAPSLKSLEPYEWHLAKSELFSVVQKYELKKIMQEQNASDQMPHSHSAARDSSNNSPAPSGTGIRNPETDPLLEQRISDELG